MPISCHVSFTYTVTDKNNPAPQKPRESLNVHVHGVSAKQVLAYAPLLNYLYIDHIENP